MIQTIDDMITPICTLLAAIFIAFSIKYFLEIVKLHTEYRRNSFHILMGWGEWFCAYRSKKMMAKFLIFFILAILVCAYWWSY